MYGRAYKSSPVSGGDGIPLGVRRRQICLHPAVVSKSPGRHHDKPGWRLHDSPLDRNPTDVRRSSTALSGQGLSGHPFHISNLNP